MGRVCDVSTLLLVKFQTVTENFFVHVVGKLHAASKLKKKKKRAFHVYFSKYLVLMFCESLSNALHGKAPTFP